MRLCGALFAVSSPADTHALHSSGFLRANKDALPLSRSLLLLVVLVLLVHNNNEAALWARKLNELLHYRAHTVRPLCVNIVLAYARKSVRLLCRASLSSGAAQFNLRYLVARSLALALVVMIIAAFL